MKRYTVKEVAKLSGVSIRTLHFYDEIGLLKPAAYGENGYRYYEREQLFLLQQILFYRELEFPIAEIRLLLSSSQFDRLQALRSHQKALREKGKHLAALVRTIDRTVRHLQGEIAMKDKEIYQGFAPEKQREYEDDLIARGGDQAREKIAESKRRIKNWKKEDFEKAKLAVEAIHLELTRLLRQGVSPADAQVLSVMKRHYDWVCQFWTPDKSSYPGLGQLYQEHPDFRKTYDALDPGLAEFLAQAMREFARKAL
jgi:DNA-binding transcriptional MerR regulator